MVLVDPYGLASMESIESRYASSSNDASWLSGPGNDSTTPGYSSQLLGQPSANSMESPGFGSESSTGIPPILGFGYGLGIGSSNPLTVFSDDEEKSKFPGQATGEKTGATVTIVATVAAAIFTSPPTSALALLAYYTVRAASTLCKFASTLVNGPVNCCKSPILSERGSFGPPSLKQSVANKTAQPQNTQRSDTARSRSSSGRLRPNPRAEGPHSSFRRDQSTGEINHYETYRPQTNPKNPNKWESVVRYDGPGADEHFNKVLQRDISSPHVHEPTCPGRIRPAYPDEIPQKW